MLKPLRTVLAMCVVAATASPATINVSVAYYTGETLDKVITSDSSAGTSLSTSGSFTAPTGTSMSGLAGFDNGRFYASSVIGRAASAGFNETLTSATSFRDVLTIDTGGACPVGGLGCQLNFAYTATGLYTSTGDVQFAEGQLDFAVLNPVTPGDRSTWLVDKPVFLAPGSIQVSDGASVTFFDSQPLIFWPVFATVARQVNASVGESNLDFSRSLVFNSFSVIDAGGNRPAFKIAADSGLVYSSTGISAVPEPSTSVLAVSGALLLWLFARVHVGRKAG